MQHERLSEDHPRTPQSVVADWLTYSDDDGGDGTRTTAHNLGLLRGQARIVLRDIDDGASDVLATPGRTMVKWNLDILRELLDRLEPEGKNP